MPAAKPTIELDPQHVLCPAHGEHLRHQWPKGYATVLVKLLDEAVKSSELGNGAAFDPRNIREVLTDRPMCYFVGTPTIRAALLRADIYTRQKCDICQRMKMAGPYDMSLPEGGIVTRCVCVDCAMINGTRSHLAYPHYVWASHRREQA